MTGTFGGALSARQIDAGPDKLSADVVGELDLEDNVLVIKRIKVHYKIHAAQDKRETIERVLGVYGMKCPLYRTLHGAIELISTYELVA